MPPPESNITPSFPDLSDEEFLASVNAHANFKQRSHDTHHTIHLPELNVRLGLSLDLPPAPPQPAEHDPFAPASNLSNTSPISIIYLGSSMLERFKTTGQSTKLGQLAHSGSAWNAGCGGDKNENVLYRFHQGLYSIFKTASSDPANACDIKLWVVASGTNNFHRKRGFQDDDVESWKMVVWSCLRIAPRSRVLACDIFERKDVGDELVRKANEMLKKAVEEINWEVRERKKDSGEEGDDMREKVVWVEARHLISKDMLVDHVHLNEEGYKVWDGVLWPRVAEVVGLE